MPVQKGDRDVPPSNHEPVKLGDLISYRDQGGALHLAVAYMYYPAFLPDGSYDPKDGFHVAYFSDHPGDGIRRSDARLALDDLRRLTWFIVPFRDQLTDGIRHGDYNERSRAALEEVLSQVPATEILTCATGAVCPRSGRWIMRGTDRAIEIDAGELLPGHPYFDNYTPQWTRWDLPLD